MSGGGATWRGTRAPQLLQDLLAAHHGFVVYIAVVIGLLAMPLLCYLLVAVFFPSH